MKNRVWARAGLFGAGFGVDLEDRVLTEIFAFGGKLTLVDAELRFKFDASFKMPFAADLFDAIATALDDLGLKDLINSRDAVSITRADLNNVVRLQQALLSLAR